MKGTMGRQIFVFPSPASRIPRDALLHINFSKAMKGSGNDCELDDDDEGYEELSDPEEVQNEKARSWPEGSLSER